MRSIVIILILGLLALGSIVPVSAAGQGGNGHGMMLHSGECLTGTNDSPNPDCPLAVCPFNQTPPRDGTGIQYGKNLNNR